MKNRYRIAAIGICALVAAVVFAPGVPAHSRWIYILHDSAHGPIFGCVAVLCLLALRSNARTSSLALPRQYSIAFVTAAFLGLGTEIAQFFSGRDASWGDFGRDMAGAAAFLMLFLAFDPVRAEQRSQRSVRASAAILAIALIGMLVAPLVNAAIQYERRAERFPVLADFTAGYDRFFLFRNSVEIGPIELPARWQNGRSQSALRVQFLAERYPGVVFAEPMPDWSSYSTLALDVTNPNDAPLELVVRVDDAHHNNEFTDRFNRAFVMAPTARQVFRIPLEDIAAGPASRRLDLQQVAQIILFRNLSSHAPEMYVSRIWLE